MDKQTNKLTNTQPLIEREIGAFAEKLQKITFFCTNNLVVSKITPTFAANLQNKRFEYIEINVKYTYLQNRNMDA